MQKIVINLPERRDRRAEMERQLHNVGWGAEFFPAIRPNDAAGFPSVGARGCFLSHLEILRQAKRDNKESVLIMEDDLNFADDFLMNWDRAYHSLLEQKIWSIFYPGHNFQHLPNGLSSISSDVAVQCTHFLLVNGPALPILVDELEAILERPPGHPEGGPMHVDGAYSTIRARHSNLRTFCWSLPLGYQRPSRTDVGNPPLLDTIVALRPLIGGFRKLKELVISKAK